MATVSLLPHPRTGSRRAHPFVFATLKLQCFGKPTAVIVSTILIHECSSLARLALSAHNRLTRIGCSFVNHTVTTCPLDTVVVFIKKARSKCVNKYSLQR